MKAILKTYRQSPRKVRLLVDLIRGKKVEQAKTALMFADKKAAGVVLKLLNSAVSNAKNNSSIDLENLFVKTASVDKGVTMKRSMPRARGSAYPINKRTSHILIELAVREGKAAKEVSKGEKTTLKAKSKKLKATS
jgi:large subunit ribosomal protein L22